MNPPPPSVSARDLPHSTQPMESRKSWRVLIDNPWLMILMLFFVTAALGLPFLWMSRGFSSRSKFVLTIAVLLWTSLVFWVFYLIMAWCIPRIWEGLRALYQ